jgi:O-antigen/teichoic acid export membrane protein
VTLAFSARYLQKIELFLNILEELIKLILILTAIQFHMNLLFFVAAFVIAHTVRFIVGIAVFAFKFSKPSFSKLFKGNAERRDEKAYRRISYLNDIGTSFLSTNIDRYILALFSTSTQVAIYAIATGILSRLLHFMPRKLLGTIAEPAFYSRYDQSSSSSDLNKMFQMIFNANNILVFLHLSLFFPLGHDLLRLVFKQDYVAHAYWPIIAFLVFLLIYSNPIGMVAKSLKKPEILLLSKISIVVNLATGIPLAYAYGALGMALSTVFSVCVKNIIIFFLTRKYVHISIPWRSVGRGLVNGILTAASVFLFRNLLTPNVFVCLALGICVYWLAGKINSVFTVEQRRIVLDLVPHRIVRPVALIV